MNFPKLMCSMLLLACATVAQAAPQGKKAKAVCNDCGKVTAVKLVERDGEGSAAGMIVGGVTGAALGSQIGSGGGRTVAMVAGAAGGAYAGKKVEGKMNKVREWHVTVRFDNGQTDTVLFSEDPAMASGDKVKRRDGTLIHAL